MYATGCQHGSSQLCRVHHSVRVKEGFPFLVQMQEVVLLASYRSARQLGCSALRHVMSCDDLQLPDSTAAFVSSNYTKVAFAAERTNPEMLIYFP